MHVCVYIHIYICVCVYLSLTSEREINDKQIGQKGESDKKIFLTLFLLFSVSLKLYQNKK